MDASRVESINPPITTEHEILVATFGAEGEIRHRNDAWTKVFGDADRPWERLSDQDQGLAASYMNQASAGSLVTNTLFLLHLKHTDQPLPVLLNFVPIVLSGGASDPDGIMITGEVLMEPTSWMNSQTLGHRMETLGKMTDGHRPTTSIICCRGFSATPSC